jgi:hypothetical protein
VRRAAVVASVGAVAIVAVAVVAVVKSRGGADKPVATVAGHEISGNELELTVEHFHEEADREGRPFPPKGTKEYRQVEKLALGLLVDRASIEAAAARLGVHVTDTQVDARLTAFRGENEGGDIRIKAEAAFLRATARNQLITEGVFRKLTAGVFVRPGDVRAYYSHHRHLYGGTPFARVAPAIRSQLLSARKNAAMARWLAKVRSSERVFRSSERLQN